MADIVDHLLCPLIGKNYISVSFLEQSYMCRSASAEEDIAD